VITVNIYVLTPEQADYLRLCRFDTPDEIAPFDLGDGNFGVNTTIRDKASFETVFPFLDSLPTTDYTYTPPAE
jgi:hypothetical protein